MGQRNTLRFFRDSIFRLFTISFLFSVAVSPGRLWADDWPQWMGPKRDDVWRERGILDSFPAGGLAVQWRTNVNRGYCGPAVVGNRLYMMDRLPGPKYERK